MASSDEAAAAERAAAWEAALLRNALPSFVVERLERAKAGTAPWLSTMTPAELLLTRSHGMRPVAMVSGTCWYHYGYSWTNGHAEGWHKALIRIVAEAKACGANAIVDVRMRKIQGGEGSSMDFTLLGTAVRFAGLRESPNPIVATVGALEFVRLLEMGIVPTGIAIGAHYEWLTQSSTGRNLETGGKPFTNTPLTRLSSFWENVRRRAHSQLRKDAAKRGNGVLADIHFGQLLKQEGDPPRYLGRHIVIGTVVSTPAGAPVPHAIKTVVDMRDEESPLHAKAGKRHAAYDDNESEGGI